MYRFPFANRFNSVRIIALALVLLLSVAIAPAFGQVRGARARVLQQPGDIITTKKANFQTGDILGTPLISITINNGAGDSFLLMKLRIEFGGAWHDDYLQTNLVKKISGNSSFTFTNSDMLSYLSNIRNDDFEMSSTLLAHTGFTGIENIANLSIPEGIYSIILTVSEITLSNPNDINSSYTVVRDWI
ncbi:MAG: hypothetical protein NT061_07345 [Spirochaetes bacterium]|nr:hypothetical protein [Spirochaetota bacterium]